MKKVYAEVIGDPVSHSKSPAIHNFWLGKLGIDAEYRACHVRKPDLEGYFARRRADPAWRGCNVTIPHKELVAPWLERLDDRASAVGAVNTVYRDPDNRLLGTNTDVDGVADALASAGLPGVDVCVIGAGGAARSAFHHLSDKHCKVSVMARDPEKAAGIARECALDATVLPFRPGSSALCKADVLINATQLGMTGQDAMPEFLLEDVARLADNALVFDMVYVPLDTELLKRAKACGHRTADGLTMLIGQAASAFEKLFGTAPPRRYDTELRRLLTS